VWGSSPKNIFVVGQAGLILHYDGSTWLELNSPTTEHLYKVWGRSACELYATGANGTLIKLDAKTNDES